MDIIICYNHHPLAIGVRPGRADSRCRKHDIELVTTGAAFSKPSLPQTPAASCSFSELDRNVDFTLGHHRVPRPFSFMKCRAPDQQSVLENSPSRMMHCKQRLSCTYFSILESSFRFDAEDMLLCMGGFDVHSFRILNLGVVDWCSVVAR